MFTNKFICAIPRRCKDTPEVDLSADYRRTLSLTGRKFMEFTYDAGAGGNEDPFTSNDACKYIVQSGSRKCERSLSRLSLITAS